MTSQKIEMQSADRVCSIPECTQKPVSRGWCNKHYHRWKRYGDPLKTLTAKNGEPQKYLVKILSHKGNDCLIWPFGKISKGYGQIIHNGKSTVVHRVVCELVHGKPPSSRHHAAHLCGNGFKGCCNPSHLAWKTPEENEADKLLHGTRSRGEKHGNSKLTATQVRKIRKDPRPSPVIAKEFGLSSGSIHAIKAKTSWAWLD